MPNLALPGTGESSEGKTGGSKSDSSPGAAIRLPAVDRLLASPQLAAVAAEHGTLQVKRAVQDVLAENRAAIVAGAPVPDNEALIAQVRLRLSQVSASRLRRVFNLSGTVIHTNLGRSLLAEEAIAAVADAMRNYAALEYDIASGARGDRDHIVEDLLRELTGAEAATVVNNNAAAVLLSLKALATRKEVIISRGELIEIGGAFRMPDIMKAAGCKLVEVGTTNRTHASDYEDACGPKTGLIVKAHWSNYAITGFTATVDDATLAQIAHTRGSAVHGGSGLRSADRPGVAWLAKGAVAAGVARRRRGCRDIFGRQVTRWAASGIDRRPGRRDRENQERPVETCVAGLEADHGGARGDTAHLRKRASARRAFADARLADAQAGRNPRGVRANCGCDEKGGCADFLGRG